MSRDEGAIVRAQQRLGRAKMLLPGPDVEGDEEIGEELATWEMGDDEAGVLKQVSDSGADGEAGVLMDQDDKGDALVQEADEALFMDDMTDQRSGEVRLPRVLEEGALILDGQYRILQWLYSRPRLNLYLGERLVFADGRRQDDGVGAGGGEIGSLVAIRELAMEGLEPDVRECIEGAAFEEFVSPVVLGSPRLPTGGDRIWADGEYFYLVMQLYDERRGQEKGGQVMTLSDVLLSQEIWPEWLQLETALSWGMQLCCIVARLRRLGIVLGDLDLATILVTADGRAPWAPLLLPSWPPPPKFWPAGSAAVADFATIFPIAASSSENVFVAPEMLGGVCDERSDVYTLGAVLYLLFTHYAPVAAARRLCAESRELVVVRDGIADDLYARFVWGAGEEDGQAASCEGDGLLAELGDLERLEEGEELDLMLPHQLCEGFPLALERVLLRALALDPQQRYTSAFELAEALDAVEQELGLTLRFERKGWSFRQMQERLNWLLDWIESLARRARK